MNKKGNSTLKICEQKLDEHFIGDQSKQNELNIKFSELITDKI